MPTLAFNMCGEHTNLAYQNRLNPQANLGSGILKFRVNYAGVPQHYRYKQGTAEEVLQWTEKPRIQKRSIIAILCMWS